MKKDLSIIITSYNTKELTVACLESIFEHTEKVNYEVIVVDNASRDNSVDAISKIKNQNVKIQIKIKKNSRNLGFAKGNNQGVKASSGKYILLLNSDTLLTANILDPLVAWMEANPEVGVFSCRLKNKDGTTQATGGYFPTLLRVATWMFFIDDIPFISPLISSYHPKASFYNQSRFLDWVTGAFFLTRREVWEENNGFDEGYFMYVEEMDYCFRAKKRGWQVSYDPKFSLIHYGGASSKTSFPIVSEFKGLKIFYKKHMPSWQLLLLRIMLKAGGAMRMILLGALKGPDLFKIYKNAFEIA